MNRKFHIISLIIIIVIFTIINSCRFSKSDSTNQLQKDSVIFDDLDTIRIDSLNQVLNKLADNSKSHGIDETNGKGRTWKLWRSLHKDCQNDDVAKDKIYFGVSNTLGIGTIIEIAPDGRIMPDFKLLKNKLSANQIDLVYNDGGQATCTFDRKTTVNKEFIAQSQFNTSSNVDLNAAMANSKDITAKMDSWQINNLLKGGLSTILSNPTEEYLKEYKKRLLGPNRYVIANEIVVNGFSATISTNQAINANLKAKLIAGLVQNVGETAAQVKFSYVDDTTIKMTTVGRFIVFCTLIEAKFIN